MINEKRLLERFLRYVQIDSPTKSELNFAKHLMKELQELGLDVYMDDIGSKVGSNAGNLIARLKGNVDGEPILFSSHMDTVSPGIGIKPQIKDGVIYSNGETILASDDKAGVATIMETLETIIENKLPHPDMEIIFFIFEEGGLNGSKYLDYSQINSKLGFIFDSGGSPGEIVTGGPAQNKIKIKFKGKPSHAGVAPEDGISAIQMAADAISNMNLLRIDNETTANIGTINGGEVTNIVTPVVDILAEARSLDNNKLKTQTEEMIKACEAAAKKFGGSVDISVNEVYGAFKVLDDHSMVKKIKSACDELGFESYTVTSGGGSDTNNLNKNGITAVNLGVGMKEPHTLNEHIAIKDLNNSLKLALEIVKQYS